MKILPDPLYMRILSGAVFAAAFVWVAISYFDVDPEVVKVFAILSVMFVGGLIVLGFFFSFVLRLFRRRHDGGLLDSIAAGNVNDAAIAEQQGKSEARPDENTPAQGKPPEDNKSSG